MTDDEQREQRALAGDPAVAGAVHAVDQMIQIVDDLETYVWTTHSRDVHGARYRLNLLWLHAVAALLIAPLLCATGRDGLTGPSFAFMRTLPGAPYTLAAVLAVGGLILGLGCVFRAKRTEMVGLALLAVFYLLFAVSFTVTPLRWVFGGHHGMKPPLYGSIVYAHLATIMGAHIFGLIQVRRDQAAVARIRAEQARRDQQEPTR